MLVSEWANDNQGYTCNLNVEGYRIAKDFIYKELNLKESYFEHSYDCWYKNNNCHLEIRGEHRYIRPSLSAKFVLKQGMDKFHSYDWTYAYHGTDAKNLDSIIQNGLKVPGERLKNGQKIQVVSGSVHGVGIYTSKIPLYSELYAKSYYYGGKYLKCMFMVRQDVQRLERRSGFSGYTSSCSEDLGRVLYKLYYGQLQEQDTQFVTKDSSSITLQAIIVKVYDQDPQISGEYNKLFERLEKNPPNICQIF